MRYEIRGDRIIDLSQTLEPGIPKPVGFPDPELQFIRTIASGDVINVDKLTVGLHSGTHMDAPRHFFEKAETIEQMPLDCVIGPVVVVDLRYKTGSVAIERSDIEEWERSSGESICAGDAVLLLTDFSKLWKTGPEGEAFLTSGWPYVTRSFAEYMIEKKVRLVGVESMDLDLVDPFDLSTSEFVGHRSFLPKGIVIVENLTNLDKIGKTRCSIIATPLKIKGGTGSPLRVIAVV